MRLSSRGKKIIVNQILLSKLWYIDQMFTIPKYMENKIEKNCDFLLKGKKWPPRYLAKLSILRGGLGILDIETQLNSLKLIWIQGLLNATNSLWNNPTLYQLDPILSFNRGLVLVKQKQILGLIDTKICKCRTMKISLVNYLLLAYISPITTSLPSCLLEKFLTNTKLDFWLWRPYISTFYYNNKCTRKVKNFQRLFNKEIYFNLQSNSTKYNKPFKFISWPNFLEVHHIVNAEIWLLLIGLRNALMDIYFLTLQYIEWATHQIFCVHDVNVSPCELLF